MEFTEEMNSLQERLAHRYPGWYFWRGRRSDNGMPGELNATRKAPITDALVNQGLHRTLPMGVGQNIDLEAQLAKQAELEVELGYAVRHSLL